MSVLARARFLATTAFTCFSTRRFPELNGPVPLRGYRAARLLTVPLHEGTRRRADTGLPDDAEHAPRCSAICELDDPGPLGGSRAVRLFGSPLRRCTDAGFLCPTTPSISLVPDDLLSSTTRDLWEAPEPFGF